MNAPSIAFAAWFLATCLVTAPLAGCREQEPVCGDGRVEPGEECDGAAVNGQTCLEFGFAAGTLGCRADCRVDVSGCTHCGNRQLDDGEECDGNDLAGASCVSRGWVGGTLACGADCRFDDNGCINTACGNGQWEAEGGESCDGTDLGAARIGGCRDLGWDGGQLRCDADCAFDESGCLDTGTLASCTATSTFAPSFAGTLPCVDGLGPSAGIPFDWFTVPVQAGDCLHLALDNAGVGAADLLAYLIDPSGSRAYGLAEGFGELDDERSCSVGPWSGYGCPEAAVTIETTGDATVLVGQWGGGCAAGPSDYQLYLAVNGSDASPYRQIGDDTAR